MTDSPRATPLSAIRLAINLACSDHCAPLDTLDTHDQWHRDALAELATLDARELDVTALRDELDRRPAPRLRPCHVTGEHEPDHHLRHDGVCSLQARDVADQMLAGRDLRTLPRELHPDCYWCGTKPMGGKYTPKASEQASWVARTLPALAAALSETSHE